ncbi:MAG TPA: hypothetical protein VI113_01400, partial [Alphaproteobacteria bacterium]
MKALTGLPASISRAGALLRAAFHFVESLFDPRQRNGAPNRQSSFFAADIGGAAEAMRRSF